MGDATGFLYLIREEGSLLADEVQEDFRGKIIPRGYKRPCLRCGKPSTAEIQSLTNIGKRWLDLCPEHYWWIVTTVEEERPVWPST